jgi:hypothetical protein
LLDQSSRSSGKPQVSCGNTTGAAANGSGGEPLKWSARLCRLTAGGSRKLSVVRLVLSAGEKSLGCRNFVAPGRGRTLGSFGEPPAGQAKDLPTYKTAPLQAESTFTWLAPVPSQPAPLPVPQIAPVWFRSRVRRRAPATWSARRLGATGFQTSPSLDEADKCHD